MYISKYFKIKIQPLNCVVVNYIIYKVCSQLTVQSCIYFRWIHRQCRGAEEWRLRIQRNGTGQKHKPSRHFCGRRFYTQQ